MSPSVRTTALAVFFCAAAGLGGGCAGVWLGLLGAHRPPSLHQLVHRELKLTPDQSLSMGALERDYAARRAALEADVRSADKGLAAVIAADEADTPRVEAAVDRVHVALDALQKATVAHVLAMRAILSLAQRAPFDREVARSLAPPAR